MNDIQVELSKVGTKVMRNNVGTALVGKPPNEVMIRFGLAAGSSDLIGWTPIEITSEMVGQTLAIFTAVEVKTKTGKIGEKQKTFLYTLQANGGLAITPTSAEEAVEQIQLKIRIGVKW